MACVDMDVVREQIMNELSGPGCQGGYRIMWHTLRLQNIQVPRDVVAELMREMDPEGCERRKSKSFKRRSYFSSGPNYTWHVDGYDKLKPYGFPIHACIDGWSRKIMWLKVTNSNNHPDIIASFFLNCVEELGGCPVKLRTDCGTENGVMAAMQCTFQQSADAHKYGSPPANQRIEKWWSFYKKNRCGWWMEFFKSLVEHEVFNPGDEIQMACLWFCFAHLLQDDLDKVKEHWNTHLIRGSRHETINLLNNYSLKYSVTIHRDCHDNHFSIYNRNDHIDKCLSALSVGPPTMSIRAPTPSSWLPKQSIIQLTN